MQKNFLLYMGYKMAYQTFGQGSQLLFAFHGFDRDSQDFKVLEPSLGGHYTIVSFDLFYHGKSDSPPLDDLDSAKNEATVGTIFFGPEDLKALIIQYLDAHQIEKFSMLAYSLGGRISLQLIELFEDRIEDVFLFAPDGLKYGFWYNFATQTRVGRQLFKKFVKSPNAFFALIKVFYKVGIINRSIFKFLNLHLDTEPKRAKVYATHIFYRHLHPDLSRICEILNTKKIHLHLFFGRYDTIIPPENGRKFVQQLNDKKVLHILDSGHHLIKDSTNVVLEKVLLKIIKGK